MPFESPQSSKKSQPDAETGHIREMSVANMTAVEKGAGNEAGKEEDNLENDPIILEKKADQLKEQINEAVIKARESQNDEDVEKAEQLLKEYREVVYKLKPEAKPEEIPEIPESITTTYTNPEGVTETIELNLESNLERYRSFYTEHQIETPDNFESEISRIWSENADKIKQAIEQEGFDDMLLIPPYNIIDICKSINATYKWVSISSIIESKLNNTKILLIHRKDAENLKRPELQKTKGQSIYDLCSASTDVEKFKIDELIENNKPLPIDGLTIGEYLIADKIHFIETSHHLDEETTTWTPLSYSGSSVVLACWRPSYSSIDIRSYVAENSNKNLGCRSARTFM